MIAQKYDYQLTYLNAAAQSSKNHSVRFVLAEKHRSARKESCDHCDCLNVGSESVPLPKLFKKHLKIFWTFFLFIFLGKANRCVEQCQLTDNHQNGSAKDNSGKSGCKPPKHANDVGHYEDKRDVGAEAFS